MTAGILNLTGNARVEQGSTYDITLTIYTTYVSPGSGSNVLRDLTGHTARMQIRDTKGGAQLRQTLLSSTAGAVPGSVAKLVMGGAAGTIRIFIPAVTTTGYTWTSAVYDLEIERTSDLYTWREVEGAVECSLEVTQ